jgi:hypothetical protein
MANEERKVVPSPAPKTGWQRPSVKFIGNVSEIFQFPGGGKLSLMAEDMGDEQRKPKGQE